MIWEKKKRHKLSTNSKCKGKITTLSPNNFHLSAANPENLNCQKLLISFSSIYFIIFLYHIPYFLFAKIIFAFQTKSFFKTNLLFRSLSKTNYKTVRWEIHHFRNIFVRRTSIKNMKCHRYTYCITARLPPSRAHLPMFVSVLESLN